MEDITNVYLTNLLNSKYTTPCSMYYIQNGKEKRFDMMAERNRVGVIIYNKTRNVLVLVRQFRASVYLHRIPQERRRGHIDVQKYPSKLGMTLEWCAAIEDKEIPLAAVAKEEVMEECGYDIQISQLQPVGVIKNMTITSGAETTFYYCEVTDDMIEGEGGGECGEHSEVVEMSVEEVLAYTRNKDLVCSPVTFMFGLYWFLTHKYRK